MSVCKLGVSQAFEEILRLARQTQVDCLLLGGDLFDKRRPSQRTMQKTMALLRKYCYGDKAIDMEVLAWPGTTHARPSDAASAKDDADIGNSVNFVDPHINVALPVFSIHGNHDEPGADITGHSIAPLDLLSTAGLVNYFGKCGDLTDLHVWPVLLRKGSVAVALYGLGAVRDKLLNKRLREGRVKFRKPAELPSGCSQWFHLLALHQNRAAHRGRNNHVDESYLPNFLNLVLWGHEHVCLIEPAAARAAQSTFHITQPGSSVATSLCRGEAQAKHVGILNVRDGKFAMDVFALRAVRPMVVRDVVLADHVAKNPALHPSHPRREAALHELLVSETDSALQELAAAIEAAPVAQRPLPALAALPLVRIRVDHTGHNVLNYQRFGAQFRDRVANSDSILLFTKAKSEQAARMRRAAATVTDARELVEGARAAGASDAAIMAELLKRELAQENLSLLPIPVMTDAIGKFVEEKAGAVIGDAVTAQLSVGRTALRDARHVDTAQLSSQASAIVGHATSGSAAEAVESARVVQPRGQQAAGTSAATRRRAVAAVAAPARAQAGRKRRRAAEPETESSSSSFVESVSSSEAEAAVDDVEGSSGTPEPTTESRRSGRRATTVADVFDDSDDDHGAAVVRGSSSRPGRRSAARRSSRR